jgi:glucosamine-6-phosphate deaminase
MKFERLRDARAVASRAADMVAETLRETPEAVLLLPAGATPIPLYGELVVRQRAGRIDLSRTRMFQLDELLGVAPNDPRSFQAFFHAHLLGPLACGATFFGLDGSAADPRAEIARHRAALSGVGPADLVLLGLGRNGHVAFNEPGSTLDDAARVVELNATTRAGLHGAFPNACPERGLTLGLAEIHAGRRIAMLVTGQAKAEILQEVLAGRPDRERPATLLAAHGRFLVLADEAAAEPATRIP